ncbi:MAG: M3 family metallopeptidase [Spirochaetota bacterium]
MQYFFKVKKTVKKEDCVDSNTMVKVSSPSKIGFASFTKIKIPSLQQRITKLLQQNELDLQAILQKQEFTYLNLVKRLEENNEALLTEFTKLSHLNSVKHSEETAKAYEACNQLLTKYFTKLSQNQKLFRAYKKVLKAEKKTLTPEQIKVLNNSIRDFELEGIHLKKAAKVRLEAINLRLSELANLFSKNLLQANQQYELIVENKKDVAEIPKNELKLAAIKHNKKTAWKFTLHAPSYITYMTYGSNRELRKQLEKAYLSRAPQNGELLEEILKLRQEKAKILNFSSYADYSLATKIAESPQQVLDFLTELLEKGRPYAKKELRELKAYAKQNGLQTPLASYDRLYYAEKLKQERFALKEEKYRPYFEKETVTKGLLEFLQKFLAIDAVKVDVPVWDESVFVYELLKDQKRFARLYFDLESRPEKRGGAWLHSWQTHHTNSKNKKQLASAFVVANFSPASATQPSLLRASDVVTLFHEMGHALQHLCSEVNEISISGINRVEWDAVEFPSQFLENFAYHKDVLKLFAKHHKTAKPLSKKMITTLVESKNFLSGIFLLRQLEFALFDMKIHMQDCTQQQVQSILDEIRKGMKLFPSTKYNKFQHGFSHIFAGGYAAGYYSYKWAELLSADAYLAFSEKGVFDRELAESYYRNVLQKGSSENAMVLFEKFIGRKAKSEALLELHGMN